MSGKLEPSADPLLDTDPLDDDPLYLREVARFFLDLRGTGLFLAPLDASLILSWREEGVPLETVLRGLLRGAEKLLAKKQPLRSLRRLKRYVDQETRKKEGGTRRSPGRKAKPAVARELELDPTPAPLYDAVMALLLEQQERLEAVRLELEGDSDGAPIGVIAETREALRRLESPESWGAGGPVSALLSLGRRFYDGLWATFPAADRAALLEEARASLRGFTEAMSEEAEAETLRELVTGLLRERYRLFEPGRLLALWDE